MQPAFANLVKTQAASATGIISACPKTVWLEVKDFFDLKWWDNKFKVSIVQDDQNAKIRLVKVVHPPGSLQPDSETLEKLVRVVEEDNYYELVYEKLHYSIHLPQEAQRESASEDVNRDQPRTEPLSHLLFNIEKAMNAIQIITTMKFEAVSTQGTQNCRFTFSSEISGPHNLAKLVGQAQRDQVYEDGVAKLARHFAQNDLQLSPIEEFQQGFLQFSNYLILSLNPDEDKAVELQALNDKIPGFKLKKAATFTEKNDVLESAKLAKILDCVNKFALDQLDHFFHNTRDVSCDPWSSYFASPSLEKAQLSKSQPSDDVLNNWRSDEFYGFHVFNGSNPLTVQRVTDLQQLKPELRSLQIEGLSLDHYISSQKLFFLDHSPLAPYQYPRQHRGMYLHATQVLLYVNEVSKPLPAAIWFSDGNQTRVVTPSDAAPNTWLFAKMHTMCADMQIYQFLHHLGSAHLCSEPLAVGVHNCITIHNKMHPVSQMLRPHFKNLLGINHFASISLVSNIAPLTDQTFGIGTTSAMAMLAQFYIQDYNFMDLAPDRDLLSRGFNLDAQADLFPYYYKDDALRLFACILRYTTSVLRQWYGSNDAMLSDPLLANFIEFCQEDLGPNDTSHAGVKGFPEKVEDIDTMARVLAIIIWTLTGHHATSFAVEHLDAYIPFRPPCLQRPFPLEDTQLDIPVSYIMDALPPPKKCQLILILNNIITLRTVPTLTELQNPFADSSMLSQVYKDFQDDLMNLSQLISNRNSELTASGERSYNYLNPANIEGSLSI